MPFSTIFYYLSFLGEILREFWWLLALIILGKFFINLNKKYKEKKEKEKEEIKDWVILQVKINREILQTPKAMEQVFNGLHVIEKGHICLELVGMERELYFIIRAPKEYKNLVESQFYAQYPEIEIKEIDDYFLRLPAHLPNKDFDLWGTEIILEKENYYPIKVYSYFEELKEEKRIDPISSFAESIAKLQKSEWFILEILIKPLSDKDEEKFINEGRKQINSVLGKKEEKNITWQDWVGAFFQNLLSGLSGSLVWPTDEKKNGPSPVISPGEKNMVASIESKISQLSFNTSIRLLYISPKKIFNESNISAFMAFLKQFNSKNLNGFKINKDVSTILKTRFLQNRRLFLKKMDFYQSYLERKRAQDAMILNTEELATIYHFPALKVVTPALIRVLSKKGEPPAGLPVE
ncbi:MAG: hypothetical protein KAS91_00980 [Candidatus Pacebacteria bacterium]|nr:hypothetical protein [Candidatus Paceibacterota bacterium]